MKNARPGCLCPISSPNLGHLNIAAQMGMGFCPYPSGPSQGVWHLGLAPAKPTPSALFKKDYSMTNPDLKLDSNAFAGKRQGPVVIVVMDGVGIGSDYAGNAVSAARTPVLDSLKENHPYLTIAAHGTAVGMPSDKDMGNSEVGHNAIGAGRVFDQGAKLVANAIADGSMFEDDGWKTVTANALEKGTTLHLMGLFSDGNVHSHIDHLKAMILEAKKLGIKKVAIHALIDGRDVGEMSALEYTEPFEAWLAEVDPNYSIASGGGRQNITMDRYDANWPLVELGWRTHVLGEGPRFASASEAVKQLREQNPGTIDQDLPPSSSSATANPLPPSKTMIR